MNFFALEAAGSSYLCVEASCEFLPQVDISRNRMSTTVGSPAMRPGLIEEYSRTVLKSFKKCMVNVLGWNIDVTILFLSLYDAMHAVALHFQDSLGLS